MLITHSIFCALQDDTDSLVEIALAEEHDEWHKLEDWARFTIFTYFLFGTRKQWALIAQIYIVFKLHYYVSYQIEVWQRRLICLNLFEWSYTNSTILFIFFNLVMGWDLAENEMVPCAKAHPCPQVHPCSHYHQCSQAHLLCQARVWW